MSKQGELEPLKFPSFRRELLYQSHWNPADDLGRIKLIISEGFPRDSPSNPVERVKNVVVFSFQHAPLGQSILSDLLVARNCANSRPDILEANGIAWPNPQMWRRPQNNPAIPVPTYYPDDGADSHLHSPRRRSYVGRGPGCSAMPASTVSGSLTAQPAAATDSGHADLSQALTGYQKSSASSGSGFVDPFSEAAYQEWVNSLGLHQHQHTVAPTAIWPSAATRSSSRQTGNDVGMPNISDYLSPTMGQNLGSDSMSITGPSLDEDSTMESLKVPTNTPTAFMSGTPILSGKSPSRPS